MRRAATIAPRLRAPNALPRMLFAPPLTPITLPRLDFQAAAARLKPVIHRTPLQLSRSLSARFGAEVWLKREDLQVVRSYKLRGAYNLLSQLSPEESSRGVVCASAGNHAQGVARSCALLGMNGVIFMPRVTPRQKITQTRMWGDGAVEVRLVGDTFDDAAAEARAFAAAENRAFVPPFDHERIIEGQGTVGVEVLEQFAEAAGGNVPDFLFMPVGGGGLSAGVGLALRAAGARTQLVGLEPEGAPSMLAALRAGGPVRLDAIETFVDGASVRCVGDATFACVRETLDIMATVHEGRICTSVLSLYNTEGLVVEPAGALSIAALDDFASAVRGQRVVCIVSGGNADVDRLAEIKERSLRFEGLKHYFLIKFAQRSGALREFVTNVLPPEANIVRFEYLARTSRETGPALVGLEVAKPDDISLILEGFARHAIEASEVSTDELLGQYLL